MLKILSGMMFFASADLMNTGEDSMGLMMLLVGALSSVVDELRCN
jgi:hypothetical protein